ncbi:MAG: YgiT-type zinc finger protein [Bacteroidetes bacterium]|nr:MAG: YgiT-type zinc finger protein [Bacteroidota bacterium]
MPFCHVCGFSEFEKRYVNEVFKINGKHVLVENIPANVCLRCGEVAFSRETTEAVRQLVHEVKKPKRSIKMDVFAFEEEK